MPPREMVFGIRWAGSFLLYSLPPNFLPLFRFHRRKSFFLSFALNECCGAFKTQICSRKKFFLNAGFVITLIFLPSLFLLNVKHVETTTRRTFLMIDISWTLVSRKSCWRRLWLCALFTFQFSCVIKIISNVYMWRSLWFYPPSRTNEGKAAWKKGNNITSETSPHLNAVTFNGSEKNHICRLLRSTRRNKNNSSKIWVVKMRAKDPSKFYKFFAWRLSKVSWRHISQSLP